MTHMTALPDQEIGVVAQVTPVAGIRMARTTPVAVARLVR
jgi:hypothetical protein